MSRSILETLHSVQQGLKAPKDLRNNFGGYNYRSAESILEAVKPLLSADKAVINVTDEVVLLGDRFYIKAVATITTDAGSYSTTGWAREEEEKKGMDGSQITGAASSYARKYALNGLLAIDDTKDSDATNTPDKPKTQAAPSTAPWISDKQVQEAITRIESGEEGVVEEMAGKFRISKANRSKLEAASPVTKAEEPTTVEKKAAAKKVEEKVDPKKELVKDGALQPNTSFDEPSEDETTLRKQKAVAFFESFGDEPGVIKYLIKEEKLRYTSIKDFVEKEDINKVLEVAQRYKASVKS